MREVVDGLGVDLGILGAVLDDGPARLRGPLTSPDVPDLAVPAQAADQHRSGRRQDTSDGPVQWTPRRAGRCADMVAVAQLARAPGCGPGGRGFETPRSPHRGPGCGEHHAAAGAANTARNASSMSAACELVAALLEHAWQRALPVDEQRARPARRRTPPSAGAAGSAARSGRCTAAPSARVNSALVAGFGAVRLAGTAHRLGRRAGGARAPTWSSRAIQLMYWSPDPIRPPSPSLNGRSIRWRAPPWAASTMPVRRWTTRIPAASAGRGGRLPGHADPGGEVVAGG